MNGDLTPFALKTMYYCHQFAQTLTIGDVDGDGVITVLDIDAILKIE
jgi:hypothetical protein